MSVDVARLRNLFHLGVLSLTFPLMSIIDAGRSGLWFTLSGISLIGTVVSIGFLLRTNDELWTQTDLATGLLTADSFSRQIDETGPLALMCFDIRNLEVINQTLGRETGDEVIALIGNRIDTQSRQGDLSCHLGGGRFAVALLGIQDDQVAAEVGARLAAGFFAPASISGLDLDVSTRVGIAMGDERSADVLHRAEIALEQAREHGIELHLYRPESPNGRDSAIVIADVQRGLDNEEFEAYLQPVVCNANGATLSFESLVRWNHPELGIVPPAVFLSRIEQLPVGRRFGSYMLVKSVEALAELDHETVGVSVNLSCRDLDDLNLPLIVREALEAHQIAPRRLTIEVPESVGDKFSGRVRMVLEQLSDIGCGISIDDFGRSSVPIEFLASLPISEIKIASDFVVDSAHDAIAQGVIRHCVALAHASGIRVVAKGVERQGVLDALVELGCDASQGFHIAHPMPRDKCHAWLRNDRVFV